MCFDSYCFYLAVYKVSNLIAPYKSYHYQQNQLFQFIQRCNVRALNIEAANLIKREQGLNLLPFFVIIYAYPGSLRETRIQK